MKHTYQQIIENQKTFSEEIISALNADFADAKKKLKAIDEKNDLIKKEKEALREKFDSVDVKEFIASLFFSHSRRSQRFYAWWEEKVEEVIIYQYAKQKRRNRKAPA